ncbi:MAG: hypothetical protein R6X35_14870 [Candidatus Krumholzibacteriia bacterium]
MKFQAIATLAVILLATAALAQPPVDGAYDSTDLGGPAYVGRYTEAWDGSGGALDPGTVLNAASWDGMTLGSQWRYSCGVETGPAMLLSDFVNAQGNGNRTYMKVFNGGTIWLSGSGPWAGGDADYPGIITNYAEYETITYQNWVPIAAVTNVQATAQFDAYPEMCMAFYIGNGTRVATTDLGEMIPANYPDLLDTNCGTGRTDGAAWDFTSVTLTVGGCAIPVQDMSWGNVKALYGK